MNWASVYVDILLGLLIAGAFAARVPASWLHDVFLADNPTAAAIWGPLVGPLLAMVSFVCSIGNIPLAAVPWNGGLSFGGVVSFLFADLIVIPVLLIYRKYYGTWMALFLFATFYAAMAGAGYIIEIVFGTLGLIPTERNPQVIEAHLSWNYTTWLNIAFLILAAILVIRFLRTGGLPMLRMMGGAPDAHDGHARALGARPRLPRAPRPGRGRRVLADRQGSLIGRALRPSCSAAGRKALSAPHSFVHAGCSKATWR